MNDWIERWTSQNDPEFPCIEIGQIVQMPRGNKGISSSTLLWGWEDLEGERLEEIRRKSPNVKRCTLIETVVIILIVQEPNCLLDKCKGSRNTSQVGIIADLNTRHRQFGLITQCEGCAWHITHWGLNMQCVCQLHHISKRFYLLSFFSISNWDIFTKEAAHSTHYRAQVGVDTQPIKVCRILPVMHPGVLHQHTARASLQDTRIEKKEGLRAKHSQLLSVYTGIIHTFILYLGCELC